MARRVTTAVALSLLTTACGGIAMEQIGDQNMYFVEDSFAVHGAGPPTAVGLDDGLAYVVFQDEDDGETEGVIGYFGAELNPDIRKEFHNLMSLIEGAEPSPPVPFVNHHIMRYSFEFKGEAHSGQYGYDLDAEPSIEISRAFHSVRRSILEHGHPVASLSASFRAAKVQGGIMVTLVLANAGTKAIEVAPVSTWGVTQEFTDHYVVVGVGRPTGENCYFHLTDLSLLSADASKAVLVPGGGSVELGFKVEQDNGSECPLSGEGVIGRGRLRLEVLAPTMLKGVVKTSVRYQQPR